MPKISNSFKILNITKYSCIRVEASTATKDQGLREGYKWLVKSGILEEYKKLESRNLCYNSTNVDWLFFIHIQKL